MAGTVAAGQSRDMMQDARFRLVERCAQLARLEHATGAGAVALRRPPQPVEQGELVRPWVGFFLAPFTLARALVVLDAARATRMMPNDAAHAE